MAQRQRKTKKNWKMKQSGFCVQECVYIQSHYGDKTEVYGPAAPNISLLGVEERHVAGVRTQVARMLVVLIEGCVGNSMGFSLAPYQEGLPKGGAPPRGQ